MIEIRDLKKKFGPKQILDGISLDINVGQTLCIIGKSGCGKSVLLKHIVGLLVPDAGYVKIDGQSVSGLTQNGLFGVRQKIGYVFQGAALFDSYTVFENVVLKLLESGQRDIAKLQTEAQFVLSSVGLLPQRSEVSDTVFEQEWRVLSRKKPSELSGGMRKRVGVARALVGSPQYVFYDEPTTGLDPVTSQQIDDLISQLAGQLNMTSIVITHDMFSVYNVADKVAMLGNGHLQFYGTPTDIRVSPNAIVQEFLARYNYN